MKRNRMIVVLASLAAAVVLFLSLTSNTKAADPASASDGLSLATLANEDLVLLTGRAIVNPEGYLETDFSTSGFKTIVTAPQATTLEIGVSSNVARNYTVIVDDTKTFFTNKNGNVTLSLPLASGTHTVWAMQASNITSGDNDYVRMNTIKFAGTVDSAAPEKDVYIEVIGDSMAGGSHSLATYTPGLTGKAEDHQVTNGWAFFAAEILDADVSVVAQGGIGLDGSDKQEADTGQTNMQSLYDYSSYRNMRQDIPYDFASARKPDAVIVGLGENDGYDANPEPLSAAWTEKAINFILQIKHNYGDDVPVVWHISGPRRKGYYYRGLYDAIHNDARLTIYDDVYVFYNWFDRNGGAATTSQVQGHPNTTGYYDGGVRLADFLLTSGILNGKREAAATTEFPIYLSSQYGNDANDGASAETPIATVAEAITRLPSTLPANSVAILKIVGNAELTSANGEIFSITSPLVRTDGSRLPVRIEPAGDAATVVLSGTDASIASVQPLTVKNVTLTSTVVTALYADLSRIELDNVSFDSPSGNKLSLYANALGTLSYANASSGSVSEIVLKNGTYDASSGFGLLAAYGAPNAGTKAYAAKLTIDENAVAENVKIFASAVADALTEASVEVAPLGEIRTGGAFVGTEDGLTINADVAFRLTGGSVTGGFTMLGDNVTVNGTSKFLMTGGGVYVTDEQDARNASIILGGSYDTATVSAIENEITGGVLYIAAAGSTPSSIYFAGRDHQTIGNVHNYTKHAAFFVMNASGVAKNSIHAEADIVLGMRSGTISGKLVNDVVSGFYETNDISRSVYFGARTADAAIGSIENTIGFEIPGEFNGGPLCWTLNLYLGSVSGQTGVSSPVTVSASQSAVDATAIKNTIYGGQFYSGIYAAPTHDTSDGTAVFGGIETVIKGGAFRTYSYKLDLGANNATVYGHVKSVIEDGFFMDIWCTDTGSGSVKDGVEIELKGGIDYTRATGTSYSVYALSGNNLSAETAGRDALSLLVSGGTYHGNFIVGDGHENVTGSKTIALTGGYFNTIRATAAENFISGGYFVASPNQSYITEGMVPLKGTYYNEVWTTTVDVTAYKYRIGDPGDSVLINVSYDNGGGSAIPNLVGGGYYENGVTFYLTAQSMRGYDFDGWYVGTTKITSAASYSAVAATPTDYVAKYVWNGGLVVSVYGDAFTVATNGTTVNGTSYRTVHATSGDSITVTYTGSGSFSAWVDQNGTTLSTSPAYTFTAAGDTEIHAKTDSGVANTHVHCICGMEHSALGGHTAEASTVWTPISSYRELMDLRNSGGTVFNLYLTDDIRVEFVSGYSPSGDASGYGNRFLPIAGQTYNICLNGHTISGGSMRIFAFGAPSNVTLVLTDCTSSGEVRASTYGSEDPDLSYAYKVFQGSATSTLQLFGGVTITGANSHNGLPGAAIFSVGRVEIYDAIIENNANTGAGGAAVGLSGVNAKCFMYGGTIQHNFTEGSTSNGGAVSVMNKASFTMTGGRITDCHTASGAGGAIYATASGSSVTIDGDALIDSCYTLATGNKGDGGAIYIDASALLTMNGGTIAECYTTDSRGGQVGVKSATFNMTGGTIRDGQALGSRYGGNVFVEASSMMNMSGGTISGGFGKVAGGNLGIIGASVVTMSGDALVTGGTTDGYAGNVFISNANSELKMTGGTVEKGVAKTQGGNVDLLNAGTKLTMSGTAKILDGTSGTYGGNVAAQATSYITMSGYSEIAGGKATTNTGNVAVTSTGVFTMTDYASVHSGRAGAFGATSNNGWGNVALHSGGTFAMSGHASVYDGVSKTSAANVYAAGASASVTISENASVYDGHAASWGGNIGLSSGAGSGLASDKYALSITGNARVYNGSAQYGGNIYFVNSKVLIDGAAIEDGTAGTEGLNAGSFGGNICMNGAGTLTLKDAAVTNGKTLAVNAYNGAGNAYGGNIASKGALAISGTTRISQGYANGYGGNIAMAGGSVTVSDDAVIELGHSNTNGGNVTNGSGTLCITGGTIRDGESVGFGGNVAANGGQTEITGGLLEGGKSGKAANVAAWGGKTTVSGGTIKGGTATNSTGSLFVFDNGADIIAVTGGYIESVENGGEVASNYISGGTFVSEPDSALIAEGKSALMGLFRNVDTSDETEYFYRIDDTSKGVYITLDEAVTGISGVSSALTGEGLYLAGAPFRISASELSGLTFDGWFLGETKVSDSLTYEGASASEAEYTAKFSLPDGSVVLTVRADAFTVKAGDAAEESAENVLVRIVPKNTEVTLTYTGENRFELWTNSSDKLLSRETSFTFPIYVSTLVKGVSTEENAASIPVLFMTEYDQLFATRNVENGTLVSDMPLVPYRSGAIAFWNKSESEIVSEASEASPVNVTLMKTPKPDTMHARVISSEDGSTLYESDQPLGNVFLVTLPAENFLYVKKGAEIVSYEPEFSYAGTSDVELTAVYGTGSVERKSLVTMAVADGKSKAISFAAVRAVLSTDAEVAEQGILFALTETEESAFVKGSGAVREAISSQKDKCNVTKLNLNTSAPKTVYARGYVILTDGTEIYSEIVSASSLE